MRSHKAKEIDQTRCENNIYFLLCYEMFVIIIIFHVACRLTDVVARIGVMNMVLI